MKVVATVVDQKIVEDFTCTFWKEVEGNKYLTPFRNGLEEFPPYDREVFQLEGLEDGRELL